MDDLTHNSPSGFRKPSQARVCIFDMVEAAKIIKVAANYVDWPTRTYEHIGDGIMVVCIMTLELELGIAKCSDTSQYIVHSCRCHHRCAGYVRTCGLSESI